MANGTMPSVAAAPLKVATAQGYQQYRRFCGARVALPRRDHSVALTELPS